MCGLLGFWQLDRAEQKREIAETQSLRRDAAALKLTSPQDISELDRLLDDPREVQFVAAELNGEWLESYEFLLDNRVHTGRAGCHVLTPLRISGTDAVVLVNRGWVGWGDDRSMLPVTSASDETVTVKGRIHLPAENQFTLEKEPQDSGGDVWPRLWQNLDLDRYAQLLVRVVDEQQAPLHLLPFVVRMDPAANGADQDSVDDGYLRDWFEPTDLWIQRHTAYAVQWFGLGIIAPGLYWYRRRRSPSIGDNVGR